MVAKLCLKQKTEILILDVTYARTFLKATFGINFVLSAGAHVVPPHEHDTPTPRRDGIEPVSRHCRQARDSFDCGRSQYLALGIRANGEAFKSLKVVTPH